MRLTIGVIFGFHIVEGVQPSSFAFPLIQGMQAAARDKNINLMVGCGVANRVGSKRFRPAWPEVDPDTDFVPVGPWNTDGLIVGVPLWTEKTIRYTQRLISEGFPLLYVGSGSGSPAIMIDNEGGIRQALEHLVQHGHRSIAFIAGDDSDTGDSFARRKAYREGVEEYGLNADSRLLDYGYHWEIGGYQATRRLLQSGVKFTAVMCSNDLSAAGAIRALREAGFSVPRDVSVTGFDDLLESLAQIPPITTVHYPLFETGYRALLLLLKRMEGGAAAIPKVSRVSTWLVPRQSCGCLPKMTVDSLMGADFFEKTPAELPAADKDEIAKAMLNAVSEQSSPSESGTHARQCSRLLDGFLESVESGEPAHFQSVLTELLQEVELADDDSANVWQSVITVLRGGVYALPQAGVLSRITQAEDLLHQARTLLSESVERRYTRLHVRRTDLDERMGLLTARLIFSSDESQVYKTLQEDLPLVNVRSCNVVFFEPRGEDPAALSVLRPLEPDAPAVRFETRAFPPPGLYPEDEAYNLALLPLFYQDEKLGYVAFDGENLDPLAALVRQLSSSIKNAQLHAKVLELSLTDGLTGVHNRRYFEIMLQKETERSRRYRRELAVIMIDIDRFKGYNDAYGHPAGDEALKEIARCIERGARRGLDVVTRYGGEEFAIILPETDAAGARTVAENVRKELVDEADRALYQAKCQGRNRTVVFDG
jgi:DNA-binding LacI/PurR family transcriptional regulator/GGDEF domain-containing protein